MHQMNSVVVANKEVARNFWQMVLDAPAIAAEIRPGQFINIKLTGSNDPLFRRPFSVLRKLQLGESRLGIEIRYKVVGRGTRGMTSLEPMDTLDLIGPLGQGFQIQQEKKFHILLGGGMGAASLYMLGEEISEKETLQLYILLGAESRQSLILGKEFSDLKGTLLISTDDGSWGYKGRVTALLNETLQKELDPADCAIYACGPEEMLRSLVPICKNYKVPAQVSLERRMMCGFGACLACVCRIDKNQIFKRRDRKTSHIQVVPDKEFGYALTCTDGPVFDIEEVSFEQSRYC